MTAGSFRGRPPLASVRKKCEKCKRRPVMAGKTHCTNCIRNSPQAFAGGAVGVRPENKGARSRGVR
jgi:hypothetical protein